MITDLQHEIANQKEEEALKASKRTSEINDLADENLKKARRNPEIVAISRTLEE